MTRVCKRPASCLADSEPELADTDTGGLLCGKCGPRILALRQALRDHGLDPDVYDPGPAKVCVADLGADEARPHAMRARLVHESGSVRLRALKPLLVEYRLWAGGLDGWAGPAGRWPADLEPVVADYNMCGGALALAEKLARGRRADTHVADHAAAVFLALKTISETPASSRSDLREVVGATRAAFEGKKPQVLRTALGKFLAKLQFKHGRCLQAHQAKDRGAILRAMVIALVSTDVFANDLTGDCALLVTELGTPKRSFFLSCPTRGVKALHQLMELFHRQRGAPAVGAEAPRAAQWCVRLGEQHSAVPTPSAGALVAFYRHIRSSDRDVIVVMKAPVYDDAQVRSYTLSARLGDRVTAAAAAEQERRRVATARGWVLGLGPLTVSWTRACEADVFFRTFQTADGQRGDLGASFSFVPAPGRSRSTIDARVLVVRRFAVGGDRLCQGTWLVDLVALLRRPRPLSQPDTSLAHDLLSLFASNHCLCFSCFLPLALRATALSLAQDEGFQSLARERGVTLRRKAHGNATERRLDHSSCCHQLGQARLDRGLSLLLAAARL